MDMPLLFFGKLKGDELKKNTTERNMISAGF
jgi:hypothetical protein